MSGVSGLLLSVRMLGSLTVSLLPVNQWGNTSACGVFIGPSMESDVQSSGDLGVAVLAGGVFFFGSGLGSTALMGSLCSHEIVL